MKLSDTIIDANLHINNYGDFELSDELKTLWDKELNAHIPKDRSKPRYPTKGGFDVSAPYINPTKNNPDIKYYIIGGKANIHYGMDIITYTIVAIDDGIVCDYHNWGSTSKPNNAMYIMHDEDSAEDGLKWLSKYGHITNPTVKVGDRVKKGQVIGYVGAANHCHFELWRLFNWRKWNVDVNENIGGRETHSVNPIDYLYLQDGLYVVGRKKLLGYYNGRAVYYYSYDHKHLFKGA